jgi:hypothetical protein
VENFLTVEERCGVDASPLYHATKIPHLIKGDTLSQAYDDTDQAKGSHEVDGAFAEMFESLDYSYKVISHVRCLETF